MPSTLSLRMTGGREAGAGGHGLQRYASRRPTADTNLRTPGAASGMRLNTAMRQRGGWDAADYET